MSRRDSEMIARDSGVHLRRILVLTNGRAGSGAAKDLGVFRTDRERYIRQEDRNAGGFRSPRSDDTCGGERQNLL